MPNPVNPVIEAALELQAFCKQQKWRFCFIGGIAVQRWSEPRFTNDADLTLVCDFGDEDRFLTPLLQRYKPRRDNAAAFARMNRVLLLLSDTDVPMDVALGATGFEQQTVKRASAWKVTDTQSLITCCAEDLVVHKAFAARAKDWLDVESILMRQRGKLNFELIWRELRPLRRHSFQPLWDRRAYIQQHQRLTILRTTIKSILVADDHPSFARACAH